MKLRVNQIACKGHGLCAELLPELLELDEWGYPIVRSPDVPGALVAHARRAVEACPVLALRLRATAPLQAANSAWSTIGARGTT